MNIHEKLMMIQQNLSAPKDQHNSFGNFNYRSCEGILEALKPLLSKTKTVIELFDDVVEIGGRIYVKATARLIDTECSDRYEYCETTAFAREEETKKGMDSSQVTGATSSYARKYALNGLFAIDDNKDSDFTNRGEEPKKEAKPKQEINELNDLVFTPTCSVCGKKITVAEHDWSVKKYNKPLCRTHQREADTPF